MSHLLIRKLENFVRLAEIERQALLDAIGPVQRFGAREHIAALGDTTGGIKLILEGIACRCKLLPDRRRQITAYFVPGDICELRVFPLREIDHAIAALGPASVAFVPRDTMLDLADRYPGIMRALWWATLVEEAITREWLVNVGQRTAFERLSHLLCEMFIRLRAVGLTDGDRCELPITQAELADTLGLSTVHVNRTLQELRRAGLITLRGKNLAVHDLPALQRVALFNPDYLHLRRDGEQPAAGMGSPEHA